VSGEIPRPGAPRLRRAKRATKHAWRMATADLRAMPGIVIIGAQRSGTTSLHSWLCAHPHVAPFLIKEVHYFDGAYERGQRWYRSRFPISPRSRTHVEASPYMLFHPLAAERAGHDLPQSTRFVALLREPAERALSHYQFERRKAREDETFAYALELEESRLEGAEEAVVRGERCSAHRWYSYRSRGRYAEQLSRWFDAVGRERILVMESERMFEDPSATGELLSWLDLSPVSMPFPALNATAEPSADDVATRDRLQESFEADNEVLFDLLGRRLWTGRSG
jgi:sulfotransferase family protein